MAHMVPRPRHRRPLLETATLILALALAAGCGGSPEAERAAPEAQRSGGDAIRPAAESVADPTRVVFLGDSLSAGYGLPESEAFPSRIERALRAEGRSVEVLNAGVSGDTSAGGLARLDWVLRSDPDLVVVELGANDALRGQPLDATSRNLRAIVTRIRDSGARVLLLGMDVPTNYGPEYAGAFAALYPAIADDLDVPYVEGFVREVGVDPDLMQPDGLHPTSEGHRVLADALLPRVRSLLPGTP